MSESRTRRTAFLATVTLLGSAGAAMAQNGQARLLRQPAINENHLVFAYANDVWITDRAGGEARRLTTFQGAETDPHLSPDGSLVAFTGQYDGNVDVYVVSIDGGSPERLTHHPGADVVKGWTPDGKVLFGTGRDTVPNGHPRFWTIGPGDSMPQPTAVHRSFNGKLDADGSHLVFQEIEPWEIEWRNYRGGQTDPIRILDLETLDVEKLDWVDSHDTDPVWLDGVVYFLSDRDHTVNVYRSVPGSGTVEQITNHTEFDAKNLEAGGGVLVYEHGGDLRVLDPATGRSEIVPVTLRGDFAWSRPQWKPVAQNMTGVSLSPTGKRVLVEARGEIFTVPTEDGDWRNLTRSSGSREIAAAWSPDGKHIAWFSDASGEYQLMIGTQDGLEPARAIDLPEPTFYYAPLWSPDGEHLMFTDEARNIWMFTVEDGSLRRVDYDTYAHPQRTLHPRWSPDSKWITYARRLDSKMRAIMLYDVEAGTAHQVTDGMADCHSPEFDRGGEMLYFLASTNTALSTGWLDMSSYDKTVTAGLYAILLTDEAESPLIPKSDEEEEKTDDEADAAEEDGGADADADADAGGDADADADADAADDASDDGDADGDADADEEEASSIQLEGIQHRIIALPIPQLGFNNLMAGPEGVVFVFENSYAVDSFGTKLWRYSTDDLSPKPFLDGIQFANVSHDGQKLVYTAGGTVGVVGTSGGASVGQGAVSMSSLQAKIDPVAEWGQIFTEAWRLHRDYFYVDNLHGADWDAVRERWEPLLPYVQHRSDLTYLMDIVGGEIAVGHSFTRGGDQPSAGFVPGGMLGADFAIENGRYRIERILRGEAWNPGLRAPLAEPGLGISEGDYIVGVDGVELTSDTNLYAAFERTANRQVRLHVNGEPSMEDARVVIVRPIASEAGLRQRQWMDDNRRRVDELSDGRLAYVWLPNTGGGGYTNFNRYYFSQQDRQGAIIDERFNGGGSAADYMVDIMAREQRGFFNNPIGDRTPFGNPQAGIFGPKVMIVNESAGSGGDLLPWLFRDMDLGTIVGTRTWGGLVGIWDYPPLMDGGVITVPRGGFYTNEGEWAVENEGVAPDMYVEMTAKAFAEGRDPQLEAAVAEALRRLEAGEGPKIVPTPEGPIRAKRAGEG